jgi:hypothetical protein
LRYLRTSNDKTVHFHSYKIMHNSQSKCESASLIVHFYEYFLVVLFSSLLGIVDAAVALNMNIEAQNNRALLRRSSTLLANVCHFIRVSQKFEFPNLYFEIRIFEFSKYKFSNLRNTNFGIFEIQIFESSKYKFSNFRNANFQIFENLERDMNFMRARGK